MRFNRYSIFVCSLFLVIFLWRWGNVGSPLPEEWTSESKISFTTTVLESPHYSDSKTIVRSGIWYIPILGYAPIIPGSRVKFSGTVEPKVILGKVVSISMISPSAEVVGQDKECIVCRTYILLGYSRDKMVMMLGRLLPEPMSGLAAGILLGLKADMSQDFYQALVRTGTLHIIAASGYNVTIVANVLMRTLGTFLFRGLSIVFGILGIIVYVLISGGSASVVRAGIMSTLTLIAYFTGRPAEARRILWVTLMIMLIASPLLIFDIGFQLSASATIGLLYIEPLIAKNIEQRILNIDGVQAFLADYLYPTLAATLSTLPIILWHFGRVSWISPLVNMLVLPFVPLIMLLTALTIATGSIGLVLGQLVAWLTYVPLAWMVWVIRFFGRIL